MTDTGPCFQVNAPNAVFETFGDEVVAVNLGKGSYYSLRDSAASIWTLLSRGLGIADVVRELSRRFEAEGAVLARAVERLVGELQSEGLIVAAPAGAAAHFSGPGAWAGARADFSEPQLERYPEMATRIVCYAPPKEDAMGWPETAPASIPTPV